jgi:hypothetical protein
MFRCAARDGHSSLDRESLLRIVRPIRAVGKRSLTTDARTKRRVDTEEFGRYVGAQDMMQSAVLSPMVGR